MLLTGEFVFGFGADEYNLMSLNNSVSGESLPSKRFAHVIEGALPFASTICAARGSAMTSVAFIFLLLNILENLKLKFVLRQPRC